MFAIEMWEETGSWTVQRWGNRGHKEARWHHTAYEWQSGGGRWVQIGGRFSTAEEADEKAAQYEQCGSWVKPKGFRVIRE